MNFPKGVMEHARDFVGRTICHFTELEHRVLRSFFTNTERKVFFMHSLPANVAATLSSMYSRLKNPRGLRGVFVDNFIPEFLACFLKEFEDHAKESDNNPTKFLRTRNIQSLNGFYGYSESTAGLVEEFLSAIHIDPEYLKKLSESRKSKTFLDNYLDAYGHNSIARKGAVELCFEQVSILAAKSVEWGRPGAGYIELSTRYVDMSGKDYYPAEEELKEYGMDPVKVQEVIIKAFDFYRELQGEKFSGPFPEFLRNQYGHLFLENPRDLDTGVIGETCDVLGNFLPAATLTSVSATVSGEALPELLKHLILDNTPENFALVELIVGEADKIGANQFIRHYEPTDWKRASWQYLELDSFLDLELNFVGVAEADLLENQQVEEILVRAFRKVCPIGAVRGMDDVVRRLKNTKRSEYDKLPNQFERVSATFSGVMSFRGWRDLHRQGFCTHLRTYLAPLLGFYPYDKLAPQKFMEACQRIHALNRNLFGAMALGPGLKSPIPEELKQFPLALGNLIGFEVSADLLEWEFCNWQRTKYTVNHEVRQIFLGMEIALRKQYPWWREISRADTVPAYIFARGSRGISII